MIRVIVGLGNPGKKYAETPHNVGRMVVSKVWERLGKPTWQHWQGNRWAEAIHNSEKLILFEPKDYMNITGANVREYLAYFKHPSDRLVVVHDDLDLPLGRIKQARGGGSGGHNGLQSVILALGTADFVRLRVGIGRPASGTTDPAEISRYVLQHLSSEKQSLLSSSIDEAVDLLLDSAEHESRVL